MGLDEKRVIEFEAQFDSYNRILKGINLKPKILIENKVIGSVNKTNLTHLLNIDAL